MRIKVKKGDTVKILAGKDRGKTGLVERVLPKTATLVVTGLNMVKKHARPKRRAPHGGILNIPAPLAIGKVMVICPRCSQPTRVAITIDHEGRRHRTCKHCREAWS